MEVTRENNAFGGAGNVANNITSLDAKAFLLGVVGSDLEAEQLKNGLRDRKIDVEGIISDKTRPTTIKTRIIAQHQQVVRVDKELKGSFSEPIQREISDKLEFAAETADAIIISDYGKA